MSESTGTTAESWAATRLAEPINVSQAKALVSVIIPIYNVEDYLEECLKSVLDQTHKQLEVICVNDGSTDSSLKIINDFAAQDSRVIVIDKPNGGYGHSVNKGLQRATGEWISIIEPDDLIDKYMYQDLLANARDSSGHLADIVKGSYWLYFDLEDGDEPYIEAPNLTHCMVKNRHEFTVDDYPEVLRHHPSIWSAIYRRSFLEAFGIKMIEPKGAGWADNPWFFETLLQAQSIIWIPVGYYYYRQTNPNASSKLRDYHMPFERLRDIREIYSRLAIKDVRLTNMLYQRTFNYVVTSILNQFGFDESEKELHDLIEETLTAMDERFILSEDCTINTAFKDYYRDFMGKFLSEVKSHAEATHPRISIILPLHNDREGLWNTIHSLLGQAFEDYEVLCYDCNSKDRSAEIIRDLSKIDERFRLLPDKKASVTEAFNSGIEEAKGDLVYFMRSGVTVNAPDFLGNINHAYESAANDNWKVMQLADNYFSTPLAYLYSGEAFVVQTPGFESRLTRSSSIGICSKCFRTNWLKNSNLRFSSCADSDGYAFGIEATIASPKVILVPGCVVAYSKHFELQRRRFEEEQEIVDYELARLDAIAGTAKTRKNSPTWRAAREALIKYLDFLLGFIGKYHAGREFFNTLKDYYLRDDLGLRDCSKATAGSYGCRIRLDRALLNTYENYVEYQYRAVVRDCDNTKRQLRNVYSSGSYRLSRKISKVGKRVIPRKFLH